LLTPFCQQRPIDGASGVFSVKTDELFAARRRHTDGVNTEVTEGDLKEGEFVILGQT